MKIKHFIKNEDVDWTNDNEKITQEQRDFADNLYNLIQSLIEDTSIDEEFISNRVLRHDFKRHCLKDNDISTEHNVRYDFTNKDKFDSFERTVSNDVLFVPTSQIVTTLLDEKKILRLFRKLFEGKFSILFQSICGFYNDRGAIKIGLHNSNSIHTTNYSKNTIDIIIMTEANNTVSMYPVDAHYLETKFNNILKHHNNSKVEFHFNND